RSELPSSLSSAPVGIALLWPPRCSFVPSSLTSSFTPPLTLAAELISLISSRFLICGNESISSRFFVRQFARSRFCNEIEYNQRATERRHPGRRNAGFRSLLSYGD